MEREFWRFWNGKQEKRRSGQGPGEVKAAWFMPEQMVRVPIGELVPYDAKCEDTQ